MTQALRKTIFLPYLVLLVAVAQIIWWGVEREPPFELKTVQATSAAPGGTVFIVSGVERDLRRKCDVSFNRHMFDSKGYRYDISGTQFMSSDALRGLDAADPDKLLLTVQVPQGAQKGTASLITVLSYSCNPLHKLWPINQVLTMKFEVL